MKPVIVLGGGGHAKVLIECLNLQGIKVLGYTSTDERSDAILGIPKLGEDSVIRGYSKDKVSLVNGIGTVKHSTLRKKIFEHFKEKGFSFQTVVHPSAVLSTYALLGEGVQVLAGAIVMPGSYIGDNGIVNTRATVDHDCRIGKHVHIAPSVTLSGGVQIGSNSHIGTAATIIQGVRIGEDVTVGAGTVILRNVSDGATVVGVPGREVIRNEAMEEHGNSRRSYD